MNNTDRKPTSFARNLCSLMDRKSIGVRDAARIAGVGASTIVSWRSGASPKDYLAVKKLAVALGTSLELLLTGEEGGPEIHTPGGSGHPPRSRQIVLDGNARITIIAEILPPHKR